MVMSYDCLSAKIAVYYRTLAVDSPCCSSPVSWWLLSAAPLEWPTHLEADSVARLEDSGHPGQCQQAMLCSVNQF